MPTASLLPLSRSNRELRFLGLHIPFLNDSRYNPFKRKPKTTTPKRPKKTKPCFLHARCQLPIDPGYCGVLTVLSTPVIRYGYDRNSARCIQFTYSGCGGNTNRFSNYNRCLTTCFYSQTSLNQLVNLVGSLVSQFT
ncbi:hypothetical protein PYW07_011785 [Mythimna separata]|uniref:BPTI/Kunitz inhibitor domain-containing protein n=1 Tax=Mythimna separata TaxID=271217 RepID=A0AAD7Y6R3_MYTSE|nr:hypothetical protein PYW07_011785 [Mythimna separata]